MILQFLAGVFPPGMKRMCGYMRKMSRGAYEDTKGFVRLIEALVEILILTMLYYFIWRHGYPEGGFMYKGKYVLMGLYALLLLVFFQNSECTLFGQLRKTDLVIGQVISLLLVNFITYFQLCLIDEKMISPVPLCVLFILQCILALVFVVLYAAVYQKLYAPHRMLLIYGNERGVGLKIKMDSRQDKYKIIKLLSADVGLEQICKEVREYDAVVLNDIPAQLRNDILKFCYLKRVRVYLAPKLTDVIIRGAKSNNLFDTPLLLVRGTGLTPTQRIAKRTMDILLCSIAMLVAAPVMLVVAAAIKLEDGGPVFFRQKRLTRGGREFEILKFRSMIVDAEKYAGAVLATGDDPRITRVGKFIRATRLDEIPQILNILKGDMSIVGPRPERKVFSDEYCREMPEFAYRLKVRGGLTGYAQIYGKYNTNAYDKLRLDMMYIENYSLLLDIKLIILTLRIIFSKDSTEGVDKAEENQKKADQLLQELKEEDK